MKVVRFFDRLEDRARGYLSHRPILYAVIGGTLIVIFWRGVWHTADLIEISGGPLAFLFSGPLSTIGSAAALLVTGLFVSFFIGDRIILSGMTHAKKIEEKTEIEVKQEEELLLHVHAKVERIGKELGELREELKNGSLFRRQ